ncbi:uncharacterized protein LOC62_03G004940 [Vanrija pseudolonga]|uniref:Uncharacterized protein n=1 Tax=Vanrija pseudolonga TaxID=143232 RepID=A0AAF1BHR7_9TREE|nr:hypothetical protein LOC62_03G004940 [Vanrija pseudolonga]
MTKAATAAGASTPAQASPSTVLSPPPPPPAVPRTRKHQTQVPPGRLAAKQRFVPPKAIGKVDSRNPTRQEAVPTLRHPLVPLALEATSTAGMTANRISHVGSHFVNRLFANLNAARTCPDSGPATSNTVRGIPSLAFTGFHEDIYSTSNEDLQVALRWWIWRMHTALQLGSGEAWSAQGGGLGLLGPDMTTWPPVVACKQVATGIFCITTLEPPRLTILPADEQTDSKAAAKKAPKAARRAKSNRKSSAPTEPVKPLTELIAVKYLTIGITGEVIACSRTHTVPEAGQEYADQLIEDCPVRPDWHAFISARKLPAPSESPTPQPLITLVKTKDANDAPHGISKAWRTRMETANQANGASDPEALDVAARVVLASCVLNSFSGEKLSTMQMDAEWLGNAVVLDHSARKRVDLYLPEPLQILSVHLPPPPCHPAIAIAHRSSGRSDYVLRETGQVIGDEDCGVAELWQGILGCDYKGAEKDVGDFWENWQDRIIDNEEDCRVVEDDQGGGPRDGQEKDGARIGRKIRCWRKSDARGDGRGKYDCEYEIRQPRR